jgi:Xaa-Pro aminopeptidase
MTETQVADVVKAHFEANGARVQFAIVGASENGAHPHHSTGSRVLKRGDAVVIDIGGRLDGYPSDMTRMAIVGEAPEGYAAVHAIVEKAVQAALAAAKPGVKASAVDKAARDVIAAAGYGEYFVHRTGHGLGIDVHEPPYITATSETVLAEGMVFSIEPGIYLPGRFGIRLEDIVILRKDGPEILSGLPRDAYVAKA